METIKSCININGISYAHFISTAKQIDEKGFFAGTVRAEKPDSEKNRIKNYYDETN